MLARSHCYRVLESVVSQVVLQQTGVLDDQDGAYGFTVDALISKFAEENEFDKALEDVGQHMQASRSLETITSESTGKREKIRF